MSATPPQRSSILAGLLLILLGVLALVSRYYPELHFGHLIRLYWPLIIVLWGVARLVDYLSVREGEARRPLLSGGEAALLILLAVVLSVLVFRDWVRESFPQIVSNVPWLGREVSRTESLPPVELPPGARVTVQTGSGDIKVTGTNGDQLRVNVRESAPSSERSGQPGAVIDHVGDTYQIHPSQRGSGEDDRSTDIEASLPRAVDLSMTATNGDLSATGLTGPVHATATHGDITIRRSEADVFVDVQSGDTRVEGAGGNVTIHRHSGDGDVRVEGVQGDALIDGEFVGDITLRNVAKTLSVDALRSNVSISGLAGDASIDSGDISISKPSGPVKINARDKDIDISGAGDEMEVADTHGDIHIVFTEPPRGNVSVTNDSGDIDLTLPGSSYFELSAVSRSGEVDCDFAPHSGGDEDGEDKERVSGTFGAPKTNAPAPRVSIATSYGTVHIHRGH